MLGSSVSRARVAAAATNGVDDDRHRTSGRERDSGNLAARAAFRPVMVVPGASPAPNRCSLLLNHLLFLAAQRSWGFGQGALTSSGPLLPDHASRQAASFCPLIQIRDRRRFLEGGRERVPGFCEDAQDLRMYATPRRTRTGKGTESARSRAESVLPQVLSLPHFLAPPSRQNRPDT